MGLDITAYSNLVFVRVPNEDDEPEWNKGEMQIYGNHCEEFAARCTLKPGIYGHGYSHGFRAGSYSSYSAWRETLAKLAGYPAAETESPWAGKRLMHAAGAWNASEGPFYELIHFSDCEGAIGPEVSAKLHRDFVEWHDRARLFAEDLGDYWGHRGEYFMEKYDNFKRAFALAADNGVVKFH